jgi:hypothetical protein
VSVWAIATDEEMTIVKQTMEVLRVGAAAIIHVQGAIA